MRGRSTSGYEELDGESRGGRMGSKGDGAAEGRCVDQDDQCIRTSILAAKSGGDSGSLWDTLLEGTVQGPSGAVAKRWLHVDAHGVPSLITPDKHEIVRELHIRYRDLLQLDPTVPIPFPAAILIRPKALVVNLESVRMLISSNQAYVLSVPKASDPAVATFPSLDSPFIRQLCQCLRTGKSTATLHDVSRRAGGRASASFDYDAPYELRALEVALATVTNSLDAQVWELERDAYPAIDRLAADVSKGVLEDVRQVKQVMGRLTGRVQRIKTELEEILNDDADMQDMYLARRAMLLGEEPPPERLGMTPIQSFTDTSQGGARPPSGLGLRKGHASDADVLLHLARPSPAGGAARPQASGGSSTAGLGGMRYAASESGLASSQNLSRHRHVASTGGAAPSGRGPHGGLSPVPAAEHLGHHTHSAADAAAAAGSSRHGGNHHPSGGGGGGGGQHRPQGRQQWQRANTVVRTIRTLRKKGGGSKRVVVEEHAASGSTAAGGGGGDDEMNRVSSAPADLATEHAFPSEAGSERGGDDDSGSDQEVFETIIENGMGMPAVDPHEIEDAEDLLESYFIQVDYLLRRLLAVNERIDDTEDLVAIRMDHRRNELVATDLMVTTLTAGFAFVAMIAGIYGMNLHPYPDSAAYLTGAIVLMSLGGALLVVAIVAWIRHRGLMFIPNVV